jgi:hypothetical protein
MMNSPEREIHVKIEVNFKLLFLAKLWAWIQRRGPLRLLAAALLFSTAYLVLHHENFRWMNVGRLIAACWIGCVCISIAAKLILCAYQLRDSGRYLPTGRGDVYLGQSGIEIVTSGSDESKKILWSDVSSCLENAAFLFLEIQSRWWILIQKQRHAVEDIEKIRSWRNAAHSQT